MLPQRLDRTALSHHEESNFSSAAPPRNMKLSHSYWTQAECVVTWPAEYPFVLKSSLGGGQTVWLALFPAALLFPKHPRKAICNPAGLLCASEENPDPRHTGPLLCQIYSPSVRDPTDLTGAAFQTEGSNSIKWGWGGARSTQGNEVPL